MFQIVKKKDQEDLQKCLAEFKAEGRRFSTVIGLIETVAEKLKWPQRRVVRELNKAHEGGSLNVSDFGL